MKKIITTTLIILGLWLISIHTGYADEGKIKVTVSEDLSQLLPEGCSPKKGNPQALPEGISGPPAPGKETGYYECEVEKGFGSVQSLLGQMIRYGTFLIGLVGVLFIVINGIMYSIGGDDKSGAKERIMKSVFGLLLLLLSGVLLNAIAPWIYTG